jgi:hypothetical protein
MVMLAPVWYLMARVDIFSGSTGWHRAYLISQAINHLSDWWLLGTQYTGDWMPYALAINPNQADITNQFIGEGVDGGIIKLLLFIIIIATCFRTIGQSVRILRTKNSPLEFLAWSIGACLLVHIVTFFSVSYFDQIIVFWYMVLAFIATCKSMLIKSTQSEIA